MNDMNSAFNIVAGGGAAFAGEAMTGSESGGVTVEDDDNTVTEVNLNAGR